jgi:peptide/nickel transport system substrate-binding protein
MIDDKTWRVKLREGVTFTDGTPFNADAVVYSLERGMRQEDSSAPSARRPSPPSS